MLSQDNLEYINHSVLKLMIERPGVLQKEMNIEIRSSLSILFIKEKHEVQFLFVNKSGERENSINFEVHQAAKYKIINKDELSKEELSDFACNKLLPLLWSIMIQTLSYNLYQFSIDNFRLPLRHSLNIALDQIDYKIIE
jgi:hypothetical protein